MTRDRACALAALLVGAALLAYTGARAALLSFTHDEALTWLFHVRAPLGTILSFGGWIPTNNHLLNTLLSKLTGALFGPSELALRLPNLAAHVAYLFFSWRLLRRFAAPEVALAGFILLNAQPFMLDFFSLCRGYGLSLGFLLAGLDSLADLDGRRETRGFALLALGCLAAFSLLYAYAGAMLAVVSLRRRLRWGSLLVTAALLMEVLPEIWRVRHELNFGGSQGFWRDTAGTLWDCSRYGTRFDLRGLPLVAAAAVAGGWRTRIVRPAPGLAFAILVAGSALAEDATHLFFHTLFLTDRMATFYLPLALLALLFALAAAPRLQRAFAYAGATLSLLQLFATLNLQRTHLWSYDADTKQVLSELPRRPMRLGLTWVFSPAFEYYRITRGLNWLAPLRQDHGSSFGDYDYYFVTPDERAEAERRGLVLVKEYRPTGNCLFERAK